MAAGLHTVLGLSPDTEQEVIRTAPAQGLKVAGLSRYRHANAPGTMADGLVVGYTAPSDEAWPRALAALVRAFRDRRLAMGA
jgi:GntR family transcriptional regulator/MocR family aminotransferase